VPPALIDLDAAPAVRQRPGRHRSPARTVVAVATVVLVALLAAAAPPAPESRPAATIAAQPDDDVFVHGDRLWIVGAAATGRSRWMHTYRLPDGKLLTRTTLQIPEPVTAVLPVGDVTLIATTLGQRPMVMAMDDTTGRSRWWQFGDIRGAAQDASVLLLGDSGAQGMLAVDPRTGAFRWEVLVPDGGTLSIAGEAGGLPRWLVSEDAHGRLDTYDGRTGRHLASARASSSGQQQGAADDLLLVGGTESGITAYSLPALAVRWHRAGLPPSPSADRVELDCGPLLCVIGPTLMTLDPATGHTRWASDRWTSAEPDGDFLLARKTDGPPELAPVTVLDMADGRTRADLGDWRAVYGTDHPLDHLVDIGTRTFFGRFDPAAKSVRVLGSTGLNVSDCQAGPGAMVCQLVAGPVTVWRLGFS